jgi:hypothetical protein
MHEAMTPFIGVAAGTSGWSCESWKVYPILSYTNKRYLYCRHMTILLVSVFICPLLVIRVEGF